MADGKLEDIVATLAVNSQRMEDRQQATEDIFKSSMVVPTTQMNLIASKLNAVLITLILIVLMFCCTFLAIWWIDRPL